MAKNECFVNIHMTPEEFGLWNYCRSVSHSTGVVYLSGRHVAADFSGISKNVIYRIADSLVEKGWFEEIRPLHHHPVTGVLVPRTVRALSHEQWAAKNPNCCRRPALEPVPESGQGVDACPETGTDLSRNRDNPVPKSGRTCPGIGTNIDDDLDVNSVESVERAKNPKSPLALEQQKPPAKDIEARIRKALRVIKVEAKKIGSGTNTAAKFTAKDDERIKEFLRSRISDETPLQADDVILAVKRIVEPLDNFDLGRAGNVIASNLETELEVIKHQQKKARDLELAIAATDAKIALEAKQIAADIEERKKREAEFQDFPEAYLADMAVAE